MMQTTDRMTWFAVRCPVGSEWRACAALLEKGLSPWFWYRVEERMRGPSHKRRHEMVPVAYFPGYVFAPASRANVRKIRDVVVNRVPLGIVCAPDARGDWDQLEIAHKDLVSLADVIGLRPNGQVVPKQDVLEARDKIRIKHGPLLDFIAEVVHEVPLDGKSPVWALVQMFGGDVQVKLEQSDVEAIDA